MAKATQKYFAAVDIVVEGVRFAMGDELGDVPAGSLRSMIRMGQAVKQWPVPDEKADLSSE